MNREDFPMLEQNYIYFDNSATTFKPKCVIDKMNEYYTKYTSNIHRGDYDAAQKTNHEYDETRNVVKNFINAENKDEIVFTKGSTESLNLVAFGFLKKVLKPGDEILVNKAEHASNVLPYLVLQKEFGVKVKYIPLNENYEITLENVKKMITQRTKAIAIAHITNVIGDIRPIDEIGKICKEKNIYFIVDASQSVGHINIDVQKSNVSFLGFSAHKMLGPTGVGVLYGKKELLDQTDPLLYGGGTNQYFEEDSSYELKGVPTKFEGGTPPIAEVIGLKEAILYLQSVGIDKIHEHELQLKKYLISELEKIDNIIIYNKNSESGIVVFNIEGVFSQDTSIFLNHYKIAIRAGNHCTKMLKDEMNIKNTCRISIALYNTKEEIDKLISVLKNSKDIFKIVI